MKLTKIISSLAIAAVVALGSLGAPDLRAQAPAAPAAETKEGAKKEPPKPTIEQRLTAVEAYFANTDPAAAVKDKDGKIPEGLTTPAGSNPGPGLLVAIKIPSGRKRHEVR